MRSDRAFRRSPWPWAFPPESCRNRASAGLVSGNDELHDLRGAVSDLQAEDISQTLRVGHFLGVGTVTVEQQTGLDDVERQLRCPPLAHRRLSGVRHTLVLEPQSLQAQQAACLQL